MIWEGAYRLYLGEIPYRDFGIPMGFWSWVVPALFFKLFGPSLFTLAKAQAFLNIISGLSFRWILQSFGLSLQARWLSILVFSLTFILGLYWPQYNHTVIVFQIISIAFLAYYLNHTDKSKSWIYLVLACLFMVITFFTKQDAGGLNLLIGLTLIIYNSIILRKLTPVLIAVSAIIIFSILSVTPFLEFDFSYWFNYGQPPHYSRISIFDIVTLNMEESRWEKLYLIIIVGIYIFREQRRKVEKPERIYTLLILGILLEAMIFQVTSYVPQDNNIFFHAFSISYILFQLEKLQLFFWRPAVLIISIFICVWWTDRYWKYVKRLMPHQTTSATKGDAISINTYILEPPECNYYADLSTWRKSDLHSFKHVRMPSSTVEGIKRLFAYDLNSQSKVLNMTELTPLAVEMPYRLERGPLWFHLGVGMFDRELSEFISKIESNYYEIVLFENIPTLNNFFPFAVREKLIQHYKLIDSFEAPRIVYPGTIEIYVRNSKQVLESETDQRENSY